MPSLRSPLPWEPPARRTCCTVLPLTLVGEARRGEEEEHWQGSGGAAMAMKTKPQGKDASCGCSSSKGRRDNADSATLAARPRSLSCGRAGDVDEEEEEDSEGQGQERRCVKGSSGSKRDKSGGGGGGGGDKAKSCSGCGRRPSTSASRTFFRYATLNASEYPDHITVRTQRCALRTLSRSPVIVRRRPSSCQWSARSTAADVTVPASHARGAAACQSPRRQMQWGSSRLLGMLSVRLQRMPQRHCDWQWQRSWDCCSLRR